MPGDGARRLTPLDALVAGTALVHGLTLLTRDHDFLDRPELRVQLV